MSEKRFVKDHSYLITYDKYCILDKVQHKHLYLDEVCEKLNEMNEDIQYLNAFLVHKGFAEEYIRWKGDD